MPKRFMRCFASDDGVTVVETMFAIMVLSIALFGLMGSLIASAHSQLDQRRRTQAVRVANDFLEGQRQWGFDKLKTDLLAGCIAGSSCAPSTETVGGVTFTITPTVAEVDPTNPALGPQPGKATVMKADATVSWAVRSQTKSLSFSTTVAPIKPDLTKDIKGITIFPDPTVVSKTSDADVNPNGQPTVDVQLTVELKGLSIGTPVSVSWTDDQGAKGPLSLTSTDGKLWKRTIPRTQIRKVLPGMGTVTVDDDADGELEFLFTVDIGAGQTLSQQHTLRLTRASNPPKFACTPASPLTSPVTCTPQSPTRIVTTPASTPTSIPIVRSGAQSGRGRNTVPVDFYAEVSSGLNFADDGTTADTVTAYWQEGNTWISAPLTYVPSTGKWRRQIPTNGQVFPQLPAGTVLPIYFQARRASDGVTSTVRVNVVLQ
jgi:type II secretory pathway pseudopilin PulG